jgi:MFS family permease
VTALRRNRDYTLLWVGLAVSTLGSRASTAAYPLLVLSMTGSPADAGLVGFAATLPYLLVQLPAGVLVDRFNRRAMMLFCDAGRALALASLVAALVSGHLTIAQVAAVAFLEGCLFVVFSLAEHAAVPHVVDDDQLAAALAGNEARTRGAGMIGPPLGAAMFGLGRAVPFVLDALTYLVSIGSLLAIRRDLQAERSGEKLSLRVAAGEIREGVVWLVREPFLRDSALLVAGSNFLFQALVLILIVIAQQSGATSAQIGLMLAGAGVGGLLGSLSAPWLERRLPTGAIVIGANWVWAVLMMPVAFTTNVAALGILFGLMAFVGPIWNVLVGSYQLANTPEHLRGRVASVETLVAYGAIPLGSLVAGVMLEAVGSSACVLALAGWMILLAAAATASPAVRRMAAGSPAVPSLEPH